MKTHAIIPIFIPHKGCPNDCVFCNQRRITARTGDVTLKDIKKIVSTYRSTLKCRNVELAFYGGSFTGLPLEEQIKYLEYAKGLKQQNIISGIHISTRPDYINHEIISTLSNYGVDTCELGVQSFDEDVLKLAKRGHTVDDIYSACDLIKSAKIKLGIQLMIGLPSDSFESCIYSAKQTVYTSPELARLYPTVVIEDTELYDMYLDGSYSPLCEEDVLKRTTEMYKILTGSGIYVMRIGLKSTDLINSDSVIGAYHPAFGSKVKSEAMKENMLTALSTLDVKSEKIYATFYSNPKSFSDLIGYRSSNKNWFKENYPDISFEFGIDKSLKDGKCTICSGRRKDL